MSKVYQCDRCKTIFEPRILKNGEPYVARKGNRDIDLCPKCYKMLTDWLNNNVENPCETCRFKSYKRNKDTPCRQCCYSHSICYEKEEAENE